MKIGIIGLGVVGNAVKNGLEKIGHAVSFFDIKFPETSINDVLETDLCFLTLPTPPREDGSCDTSIVEQTLHNLQNHNYRGVVVIKSTVIPGTTDRFSTLFHLRLAFCPEFLRERAAFTDFAENHDVCVIGAYDEDTFKLVKEAHGSLPKNVVHLTPRDAEFTKYFSNIFNALRIIFANEFYDVCKIMGADYTKIKNAMVYRSTINDAYLDCNENFRGFGGVCLPKDTAAFAQLVNNLGLDRKLFELIVEENKKFRATVPEGMRLSMNQQQSMKKPTKKILITGGAGFIGFHLATHLVQQPENEIMLVDNLQRGRMDEELTQLLTSYPDRIRFITGDLTDSAFYTTLDQDFDQVYHLAAVNGTKHFYKIPHEVLRINVLSLTNLLEWITRLTKKPKLCFTSSNEAYAGALESFNQLPIPTPEKVPLVISDTYNPRWTYAGTKLIGEQFVIHYAAEYGFPAVIIRPHNFYGPRAGYDHVIPEVSERIIKHEDPFTIFGSDETRTFCYITDAVEAMQQLMDSPTTNQHPVETIHIGGTQEITMQELMETMFEITGWHPIQTNTKASPIGSVKRRLADITKIKQLVGWTPKTPLKEGLKKTFAWYQAHPKT